MIKIRGAVVTGFEFAACEELTEKFGVQAISSRGAVVFDLPNDANLCQVQYTLQTAVKKRAQARPLRPWSSDGR